MGDSFKRMGIVLLGVGALILGLYLQKRLNWGEELTENANKTGFCSHNALYWRHRAASNDITSYFYVFGVIFIDAYCGKIDIPDNASRPTTETFQSNQNPYDAPSPSLLQSQEFILGRRALMNDVKVYT